MLPNSEITIYPNGDSKIVGLEHSEQCHKLSDLGHSAGKVTSEKDEDHQPAFQSVQRKG